MQKNDTIFIIVAVLLTLVFTGLVIAAGNSNGVNLVNVYNNQNIFTCTEWGICTPLGAQTKTCIPTPECPGISNTPADNDAACVRSTQ